MSSQTKMSSNAWSAESLFERLLAPLYPPELLADLDGTRARDINPASNPRFFAELADTARRFQQLAPMALGAPNLLLDGSDASMHRLGSALTLEARARCLRERAPDGLPLLVHVILHGAAYTGECIIRNHAGQWQARQPLWESRVRLVSAAGDASLAVLSWWLRALSDEEVGRDLLSARYRIHVEEPCADPSKREPFLLAPTERHLPRLKLPSYDRLHKYLRAHLPELRDLGQDFPSPERFAELAFSWLQPLILGRGSMVLLYGPTAEGIMLLWLDQGGFVKSAFLAGEELPEPRIELDGEILRVHCHWLGKEVFHELLWWGP